MKKTIKKIMIEELDYYIELDLVFVEFPQVGDFISILELCSDDDKAIFERTTIPKYLHLDFINSLEYLKFYRWQVAERTWLSENTVSLTCRKIEPF